MTKDSIISESFNTAIEVGFNRFLEKHATNINCDVRIDEEKLIQEVENNWLNQSITEIEDITPKEYIGSLNSLEDIFGLFIEMASVSDVGVPDILIAKLKDWAKPASDMLFSFVTDWMVSSDQSKVTAVTQSIYAIGCLKCEEYKESLIKLLTEFSNNEMLSEAVCAAISEYGESILEELFVAFRTEKQETVKEYLLTCVAEISKQYHSDEIFYFLKDAFKDLENVRLIVEVLGDYGDGRAIPFLRGYIQKNIDEMDKTTFNHIRAVIKKLGGEIKDLVYRQ